jgi:hypothetical protein
MNAAEAIKAYGLLDKAISTSPADNQEQRKMNKDKFIEAFKKILKERGMGAEEKLQVKDTTIDPCKT